MLHLLDLPVTVRFTTHAVHLGDEVTLEKVYGRMKPTGLDDTSRFIISSLANRSPFPSLSTFQRPFNERSPIRVVLRSSQSHKLLVHQRVHQRFHVL